MSLFHHYILQIFSWWCFQEIALLPNTLHGSSSLRFLCLILITILIHTLKAFRTVIANADLPLITCGNGGT